MSRSRAGATMRSSMCTASALLGAPTRRYASFSRIVAPLGRLERLVLSERYAWQLRLASGLEIMLGRDVEAGEKRLAKFVQTYGTSVDELLQKAPYVDLRY